MTNHDMMYLKDHTLFRKYYISYQRYIPYIVTMYGIIRKKSIKYSKSQ